MKKIILLFFCFAINYSVFALDYSLTLKNTNKAHEYDGKLNGIDHLFIIDKIESSTSIEYSGEGTNLFYYMYKDGVVVSPVLQTNINNGLAEVGLDLYPEMGYVFKVDDDDTKKIIIWVVDYQAYLPAFTFFESDPENDAACENTLFKVNEGAVPPISYQTPAGGTNTILREFTITYNTKEYNDKSWNVVEKKETITFPTAKIEVPASKDPDTDFTLSGDQFARKFGYDLTSSPFSIEASDRPVTAVAAELTMLVTVRDALNEVERPNEDEPNTPFSASAPVEVLFESRPSDENAMFDWKIYKGRELLIPRTDKDHRYTFTAPGKYNVVLEVNNGYCSFTDSVEINVTESLLEVPNVFTPNGDGVNDEFRVTFRSLESFHCWVYNNWGKLVYEWTDPARGWDGRVNGKKAPSGTYFYIIKARGTDGVNHNKKGDVSIIR